MPQGAVKSARDEELWSRAKARARKQYPDIKQGSSKYWRVVQGIFSKMKGNSRPKSDLESTIK